MSLPDPLVLIDLETTGANPVADRITEIALLRIEGGELVERWQSLVNPERPIPGMIQRIIGITDAMVAQAPVFAELADRLRALLDGAVFVAHNARFDYGFLSNEYGRLGQRFEAPVLCTVKLSRALYPEFHRHGLDALIERHGFVCEARHRAMGDAEVLQQFLAQVSDAFSTETLARACAKAMKAPPRPPGLPVGVVEGLPDAPGVYVLFDERDRPLYVGRAMSLRARVMEQFAAGRGARADAAMLERVRRLDWQPVAGELSGQLQELALQRQHDLPRERPAHGRPTNDASFGLRLIPNRKRPPILERVALTGTDPVHWQDVHGVFRAPREADAMLRELAQIYQLCPRRLGLEENGKGPCTAHLAHRCAGVCAGRETIAEHDRRLLGALGSVALASWPWPGPVVVRESWPESGLSAWHVFDRWCHLGSGEEEAGLRALLAQSVPCRFDPALARILIRWLAQPEHRERVEPLGA